MQFSTVDCAKLTDPSVSIIAEHKLLPSQPTGEEKIVPLGPLESLVAPHIPVAVLYLYEHGRDGAKEPLPFDAFKRSLEETLNFYPQLAGRLHIDEDTGKRSMRDLRAGALLLQATCSHRLQEFSKLCGEQPAMPAYRLLDLPAGGNAFFAPFSPDMKDVLANPVLSVQHTRFACGSVAVGIRLLHTLADAAAFVQFVNDVASVHKQLADGAVSVALPPTGAEVPFALDWDAKLADDKERAAILAKRPPHMFLTGDTANESAYKQLHDDLGLPCPAPLPEVTVGKALGFTHEQLNAMREKYQVNSSGERSHLSLFQVLSAFLYTRVYSAKLAVLQRTATAQGKETPSQMPPTTFLTSINIRKLMAEHDESGRLSAERYFGNGVYAPLMQVPLSVATAGHVEDVAACVHQFLKHGFPADDAAVLDMVRWIALQPNIQDIRTTFLLGGFMVSAWNHFDLYNGAVFGEYRPVLVATPFTPISLLDTLGYYLPLNGNKGERGLLVYLATDKEVWELLEQSPDIAPHVLR